MVPSRVVKIISGKLRSVGVLTSMVIGIICLPPTSVDAADYTVKRDGTGDFTTIQACADAAQPGDTCLVSAGTYSERVTTKASGGDSSRITFKADGAVTMRGMTINHAYVTVDGFTFADDVTSSGVVLVNPGGNYCEILNNTWGRSISTTNVALVLARTGGDNPTGCTIRGNSINNFAYLHIYTGGSHHLFENNDLRAVEVEDYFRPWGHDITFRRNKIWFGRSSVAGHADITQIYYHLAGSYNILFEENWIVDQPMGALGQYNAHGPRIDGTVYEDVKNYTFRRNVFVNISGNWSFGIPGATFENNTFYLAAFNQNGIGFAGSLQRGWATNATLKNNVFLAGGLNPEKTNSATGFYTVSGVRIYQETLATRVTGENIYSPPTPIANAIFTDLVGNAYIDGNGYPLAAAQALTDIAGFALDQKFDDYRQGTYDNLIATVALHNQTFSTFNANYNYVAGSPAAGYPAKSSSGCTPGVPQRFKFCEANGINGGDPHLADLASILGPDGIPFTLDDGLKPLPTSPLCGKGENGRDIGAYSCDPNRVFPDSVPAPRAPTNLRIVPQ